jgi:hypothetical protein
VSTVLAYTGSVDGALPGAIALRAAFAASLARELAAAASLLLELEADLPEIRAQLDVSAGLIADIKASLVAPDLIVAASLTYAADAMASIGLAGPELVAQLNVGLDAQLAINADLSAKVSAKVAAIAEVKARIGLLKAELELVASFDLQGVGVRVYTLEGPLSDASFIPANLYDGMNGGTPVFITALVTDNPIANEAIKKIVQAAQAL